MTEFHSVWPLRTSPSFCHFNSRFAPSRKPLRSRPAMNFNAYSGAMPFRCPEAGMGAFRTANRITNGPEVRSTPDCDAGITLLSLARFDLNSSVRCAEHVPHQTCLKAPSGSGPTGTARIFHCLGARIGWRPGQSFRELGRSPAIDADSPGYLERQFGLRVLLRHLPGRAFRAARNVSRRLSLAA